MKRAACFGGRLFFLDKVVMQRCKWGAAEIERWRGVANEKNLTPLNKRTKKEQRRIQSEGGKASGEARRQRKTLRENMNLLLGLGVTNSREFNKLTAPGVPAEDIDNAMLLTAALFKKAAVGDVAAYREIRDLVGESGDSENGNLLDLIAGLKHD